MDVSNRSTYASSLQNLSLETVRPEGPSRVRGESASTAQPAGKNAGLDSSELSPAAHAVAQTMKMSDIRSERVASLQQQIVSGTYHVAAQDVADAIVRNLVGLERVTRA